MKWLPAFLFVSLALPVPAQTPTYQVVKRFAVGGEGGWDYLTVDNAARRLYIARGTHVMVIDSETGKSIGDIPNTPGVHGIALVNAVGRGYISNGRGNSVTVFDLKTLKPLMTIPVGQNPDAIVYETASRRVFTCNGRSQDLTVINPITNKVEATIALSGKPEEPASDGQMLFVNIEDKSVIERVDLKTMKSAGTWSIAPVEEPTGLAYDPRHHRLFATGGNRKMAVVDAKTGKVVATPPIGDGCDGAEYDARRGLVFASNGEGSLTVIRLEKNDSYEVVQTLPTMLSARTLALDAKSGKIYLPAAQRRPGTGRTPMVPNSFTILVVAPASHP